MGYFLVGLCIGLAKSQEHNLFTAITAEELSYYESAETILTLNQGTVKGLRYPDLGIDIFYGIPYAKPVGRFEHSEVLDSFSEEIDGTKMAAACPQASQSQYKDIEQNEDCLTLDIYIPIVENEVNQNDLFFWVHGGSFTMGTSSEYSGFTQVNRGNIVVSTNYRLGPLGFFHYFDEAEEKTVGGNYGLNDQLQALTFINQNKEKLNYNRLTLSGESAGASSLMLVLHHSLSRDKIDSVISYSGGSLTALSGWSSGKASSPLINTKVMNLASGITGDTQATAADAAKALKSVNFEDLLSADEADTTVAFSLIPHDGVFFEENFIDQFIAGNVNTRASLMITANSWEGNLIVPFFEFIPLFFGEINKETLHLLALESNVGSAWELYKKLSPDYDENGPSYDELYDLTMERYQNEWYATPDQMNNDHWKFMTEQMAGDNWIKFSSYLDALVYSKAGSEVFLYLYDVDGLGDFIANTKESRGLGHAKELVYTWGTSYNQYVFPFMSMGQKEPKKWELDFTKILNDDIDRMVSTGRQDIETFPKYTVYQDRSNSIIKSERADNQTGQKYTESMSTYAIEYWKKISGSASQMYLSLAILVVTTLFI